MSGGRLVVCPSPDFRADPALNTLVGNCVLYGATGGTLFVHGIAGDRFAIRNSGAAAVVEGVGAQACEYMTRGRVVILGRAGANIGAGMTGGILFVRRTEGGQLNEDSVRAVECSEEDVISLRALLADYAAATGSRTAQALLAKEGLIGTFLKVTPGGEVSGAISSRVIGYRPAVTASSLP